MERLNTELQGSNLEWCAVDVGTKKILFYDVVYWLNFVGVPILSKVFDIGYGKLIDLRRFKRNSDSLMTWGMLVIEVS